jgi:hypothetical protein
MELRSAFSLSGLRGEKRLGIGVLSRIAFAGALIWPASVGATLREQNYLPSVLQHVERARVAAESGQNSIAMAHARMVLHDQGLRVYIDLSKTPDQLQGSCRTAAEKAVQFWNQTLGSQALTVVDTPSSAQVRILFQRDVTLKGTQVGGYCAQNRTVTINGTGEAETTYNATIYARYQLPNGTTLNDACLLNVVTHEFGHVYGLSDCADSSRMMGALNPSKPKFELHADEVEALRELRLTTFRIQRSASTEPKGN